MKITKSGLLAACRNRNPAAFTVVALTILRGYEISLFRLSPSFPSSSPVIAANAAMSCEISLRMPVIAQGRYGEPDRVSGETREAASPTADCIGINGVLVPALSEDAKAFNLAHYGRIPGEDFYFKLPK
jgi:hypothetical protein